MEILISCEMCENHISNAGHGILGISAIPVKTHETHGCAYFWGMRNTVVKHAQFATSKVLGGLAMTFHWK